MKSKQCKYKLFIFLLFWSAFLQAQNFQWVKHIGTPSNEIANSIVVDASGNIYTTGFFSATVDFDPGVGVFNLTAMGLQDIFIQKMDASGNFIWAKRMGGVNSDFVYSITVDAGGNVYTTGSFSATVDFDPGAGVFNLTSLPGCMDMFVSKLDASGNFVLAKRIGGAGQVEGRSISVDTQGNIYTTGGGTQITDFDPGVGVFNLVLGGGYPDTFVSKLDASGNFVWAKRMGNSSGDRGDGVLVDTGGNVYITGWFHETMDFDPGAGVFNLVSNGYVDIFICKLDASGNFVWAKSMGSINGSDYGTSIAIDALGYIYTTGNFFETVDFDPGAGVFNLTSSGVSDIFVSKLDASGNFVWAKKMGGAGNDNGKSIALDVSGNVYTTGYYNAIADFDPGSCVFNLSSAGGDGDVFVSKLDASGNFMWAKSVGGTFSDYANAIAVEAGGNVYTTGWFQGVADFDPSAGVFNLTSMGSNNLDIFILKLKPCPTITITPSLLPKGIVGTFYNTTITQVGLLGNINWSMDCGSGSLPNGLSLNPATGVISGIPTIIGTSNFTIKATDGNCSKIQNYTLEVVNSNPILSLESSLSTLVKVSPNPSTGDFHIDFGNINTTNAFVSVYDIQGRRLFISKVQTNLMDISLEKFVSGIYILEVETTEGKVFKKLLKQ